MLTSFELTRKLCYNEQSGLFTWLQFDGKSNRVRAGEIAGTPTTKGYIAIRINRAPYLAHRLAWLYMTGSFPINQIDHINRIRTDNRWCNLRDVTQFVNRKNSASYDDASGAFYDKCRDKWQSWITFEGRKIFLGRHDSREIAECAYKSMKNKLMQPPACRKFQFQDRQAKR